MPPSNDNFASAEVIGLSVAGETHSGTLVGATTEAVWEVCNSTSRAVWYKLTPSKDGILTWQITKTAGTAAFVPEADLYSASPSPPSSCADFLFTDSLGDGTATPPGLQTPLKAGVTYWISVEDYNFDAAQDGTFDLSASFVGLWDSFEAGSITSPMWKMFEHLVGDVSPNAAGTPFTVSAAFANEGVQALKLTANGGTHQKSLYVTVDPGSNLVGVDYWLGYRFLIPDWNALWTAGDQQDLFGFIQHGASVESLAQRPVLIPDSSSTGHLTDVNGVDHAITPGVWHEYRIRITRTDTTIADIGHRTMSEYLDGAPITSNVALTVGTAPTGINLAHLAAENSGAVIYFDPVVYSAGAHLSDSDLQPVVPPPPLDPGDKAVAVFVDRVDVTACVLSGSVTRKLNRPWQATWRMPIDCSVMGPCSIVHIFVEGSLFFTGRITQLSDDCPENFCYTEYTAMDAMEILSFRPVRDDDGDFSKPDILDTYGPVAGGGGPAVIEAMLMNTETNGAGIPPHHAEGQTFIELGGFAAGLVDLSGAPADWPMSIAEMMTLLSDTGEVDFYLTPLDDPDFLARIDVFNGNYGRNLTGVSAKDRYGNTVGPDGHVTFDYGTGLHNVRLMRQTLDSTNICNKLWYYVGPRRQTEIDPQGDQHWCFNVTGDDHGIPPGSIPPGLAYPPGGDILDFIGVGDCPSYPANNPLGLRRCQSQQDCGVRMEVKIWDAQGGNCGDSQAARELYRRMWQEEQWIRCVPRDLVHVTPVLTSDADLLPPGVTPVHVGDFDIGDLVSVQAGTILRGGFSGAQRVYEYTVTWDDKGVIDLGEILTSSDQEGSAG